MSAPNEFKGLITHKQSYQPPELRSTGCYYNWNKFFPLHLHIHINFHSYVKLDPTAFTHRRSLFLYNTFSLLQTPKNASHSACTQSLLAHYVIYILCTRMHCNESVSAIAFRINHLMISIFCDFIWRERENFDVDMCNVQCVVFDWMDEPDKSSYMWNQRLAAVSFEIRCCEALRCGVIVIVVVLIFICIVIDEGEDDDDGDVSQFKFKLNIL